MKVIGITGGVGCGKTTVLEEIKKHCQCRVILADQVGNEVKQPGTDCYKKLVAVLGEDVLGSDGTIDKNRMAEKIFADSALLEQINAIIHPAVNEYIHQAIVKEREENTLELLFIEAALLIECGYETLVDELWYIFAKDQVRMQRLQENRQYSLQKIQQIMNGQLTEEEFRAHCRVTIDNSHEFEKTKEQIIAQLDRVLER